MSLESIKPHVFSVKLADGNNYALNFSIGCMLDLLRLEKPIDIHFAAQQALVFPAVVRTRIDDILYYAIRDPETDEPLGVDKLLIRRLPGAEMLRIAAFIAAQLQADFQQVTEDLKQNPPNAALQTKQAA